MKSHIPVTCSHFFESIFRARSVDASTHLEPDPADVEVQDLIRSGRVVHWRFGHRLFGQRQPTNCRRPCKWQPCRHAGCHVVSERPPVECESSCPRRRREEQMELMKCLLARLKPCSLLQLPWFPLAVWAVRCEVVGHVGGEGKGKGGARLQLGVKPWKKAVKGQESRSINKREARAFILLQFGWSSRDAVLSVPLRLACETLLRVNAAFLKYFSVSLQVPLSPVALNRMHFLKIWTLLIGKHNFLKSQQS